MRPGWVSRTLRTAVFAAVCVLLAALGHVMMSGTEVPLWALVAGTAATGAAGWCLTGRERGLPLIVAVVVTAQTLLHSAFSLAQSAHAEAGHTMDSMDMGGMHMSSTDSMDMASMDATASMSAGSGGSTGSMSMANSMGGGTSSSLGMLAAHLLAALLCGLWLAYGERAAFRILRAVAARLVAPLRLLLALPATPDRPRVRPHRRRSDRAPRLLHLTHAITSRGPPAATAVV
ncbi:hypothetical protein ACIQI8_08990 [Streptomyces sp. NPDC092369]|uniref:hypothetical protein n=1 Tax=Streptomyces sp. NPDC092369 TaxID=3366015 RepID=UPI00382F2C73